MHFHSSAPMLRRSRSVLPHDHVTRWSFLISECEQAITAVRARTPRVPLYSEVELDDTAFPTKGAGICRKYLRMLTFHNHLHPHFSLSGQSELAAKP